MRIHSNIIGSICIIGGLLLTPGTLAASAPFVKDANFKQAETSLEKSPWQLYIPKKKAMVAETATFSNGAVTLTCKQGVKFYLLQRNLPLEKGQTYKVIYEVKGLDGCKYSVYIEWITDNKGFYGAPLGAERKLTSPENWLERSFKFKYDYKDAQKLTAKPYIVVTLPEAGKAEFRNFHINVVNSSQKSAKNNGEAMAGGVNYTASSMEINQPTLTGVAQQPPTRCSLQTNQLGNTNQPQILPTRKSSQIKKSIAGISFHDEYGVPTDPGCSWSPAWLIAGPPNTSRRDAENCYSSISHKKSEAEEWIQIQLKNTESISEIILWSRNASGLGFPIDFQIWCRDLNSPWTKVIEESNFNPAEHSFPLKLKISPVKARFIKLVATRLRPEGKCHYLQLSRIGLVNTKGENVALLSKGAEVTTKNPLTAQSCNYDYNYSGLFDAGIKWTITCVTANSIAERLKKGKPPIPETLLTNLEHLNKNGVQVILRLEAPSKWVLDGEDGVKQYLATLKPLVMKLRGTVAVWAILNEENMYNMSRYKKAMNNVPGSTPEQWTTGYVRLVSAAADLIHQLDSGVPVEIETALFDFGWTETVLKQGLKNKIDRMGVHVYKESPTEKLYPEMVSTFIRDGKRFMPEDQPFKTYMEEILAYQKLLHSINPKISMNVTETCVNVQHDVTNSNCMAVSEKSQAKFLARLYWLHYVYDIGPTCWWGYRNTRSNDVDWGILDSSGRRRDAWYALRNISAIMDSSFKIDPNVKLTAVPEFKSLFWQVFVNEKREILIPYWGMVPMRDNNTGIAADFCISGVTIKSAEVIDMFNGSVQPLDFIIEKNKYLFKKMIIRDYPLVIRINHNKKLSITGEMRK